MPAKRNKNNRSTATQATNRKKRTASTRLNDKESGQDRLNIALAAAQIGIWDWDLVNNTVIWSENAHAILGLTSNGFDKTFETYLNLVHPEDKQLVLKSIGNAIKEDSTCQIEHRLNWPDGTTRWIESIGKVSYDRYGRALRIIGTMHDITKRKEIEYEREDWKKRHELITTSAGIAIYDYDLATGNIIWSENAAKILGYKPTELNNIDKWLKLVHPKDARRAFDEIEAAQEAARGYEIQYRFKTRKKHFLHILDTGFFIGGRKGTPARILGMVTDVTSLVDAKKSIADSSRFRKSLEQTMPGILYVYDVVHQKLVYTNKSLFLYIGYTMDDLKELEGQPFLAKLIHPDDIKNVHSWTTEESGVVKESEYRIRAKDNTWKWFMTRHTPFKHDHEGKVQHIIGIAQDITSKKRFEEQLHESEESYRELFDTVNEAIYIIDENEKIIDVNKGACRMSGYSKKELVGVTPEFLAEENKNDFSVIRHRIMKAREGESQSMEFWSKKKNGDVFLQEISLTRGNYFGKEIVIATGWDVTKRLRAEQAARESEQRFRTLQQASFGGIGLHDQGFIIDCNQGLSDITGYPYSELIGRNGLELISPEWRPFVLEKIKGGYDQTYDVEGLRKDGSKYFLEIHGKNIPYQGRVIRVTEFRDITERKKAESKILEQNKKLQSLTDDLVRKNNQLEEFTQIVSHNLRSPAGNIMTLLNLYDTAKTEEERQEYINLLKESSATTLYMLNDINEVLKIKQTRNIEKQILKFQDVLQQAIAMLNAKIAQSSAEISSDFSACEQVEYPEIYLESVVLNLLDNALKYSDPARKPVIRFKAYKDRSGHTVLEVSDNGLGINLNKYGHQLFKLRKTFHRHPESRGIGLFMIKNQIEAMGGEVSVQSKENEGTTFFVNFDKYQSDGK